MLSPPPPETQIDARSKWCVQAGRFGGLQRFIKRTLMLTWGVSITIMYVSPVMRDSDDPAIRRVCSI